MARRGPEKLPKTRHSRIDLARAAGSQPAVLPKLPWGYFGRMLTRTSQEIFEPDPSRREWDPAGYLRITVLRDTLSRLSTPDKRRAFHKRAAANLKRWASEAPQRPPASCIVEVLPGDWGDVTLALTKRYGKCFAVLNMANAYLFGGGYAHGQVAQEENMFRRTDCADRRLFITRVA